MIRRASIKTVRIDLQVQEGTTTGDPVEVLLLLGLNSRSVAVWLPGLLFCYAVFWRGENFNQKHNPGFEAIQQDGQGYAERI